MRGNRLSLQVMGFRLRASLEAPKAFNFHDSPYRPLQAQA